MPGRLAPTGFEALNGNHEDSFLAPYILPAVHRSQILRVSYSLETSRLRPPRNLKNLKLQSQK